MTIRIRLSIVLWTAVVLPSFAGAGEVPPSRYVEDYPVAASKKGLQVEDVADALALGIKHAAINVDLCRLVDVHADDQSAEPAWELDGRRFHFRGDYLAQLDHTIKELSSHGVLVNLIILAYESPDERTNQVMLHPGYDPAAPNHLGMFNTTTPEGRAWLTAVMEFLAERWSRSPTRSLAGSWVLSSATR